MWEAKDEILSEWTDVINKKLLSMFPWELLGNNKGILFLPENEHSQSKKRKEEKKAISWVLVNPIILPMSLEWKGNTTEITQS